MASRPADTLLVERARDFLVGGPADSATLVRRVCQLPGVGGAMAERIADELLAPYPEFVRLSDGRWQLGAGRPSAEVGAPGGHRAAPPRADTPAPSFDDWMRAREAARAGDTGEPAARRDRHPNEITVRATDGSARSATPGDDDLLERLSYAVVDVETTGGSPQAGHRVTEIAAVVVRDGAVREVYETLVNPERPIPPAIVRLTGITSEMVRDQRPFRGVCDEVVGALEGHVFVAHNVGFDWRFVSAEVTRASGRVLEGRRLCTVRLARKLLPQLRSRSLGYVADWYGADAFAQTYFEARHGGSRPWRHSAAGDAVATAHCLIRLLRDAAERGVRTWGELDRWLAGGSATARRRRRRRACRSRSSRLHA
jgi:DNA polymerase-3 subunit epsilon